MTWILGVNTGFAHDASATLIGDQGIVLAVEEERLDRVKFGKGFPHLAIERCLRTAGISWSDVDAVGFNFDPWRMFRANVRLNLQELARLKAFKPALFYLGWSVYPLLSDLREAEKIKQFTEGRVAPRFLDHHACHAASAFYASPFEEAAILTMDNRGEEVSATISVGRGTAIERLGTVSLPHSLGMLYLSVTLHLGFHIGDEYKVMGLAAYGQPAYADLFADLLQMDGRGSFRLNPAYFDYMGAERWFSRKFTAVVGPRRRVDEPITQRHRDLACSLQRRLEDVLARMAEDLHQRTGLADLCLAGGVAFNSVANGALLRRSPFRRIFVQPAAGDAGTSLGAAFEIAHREFHAPRYAPMTHACVGPSFRDEEVEEALQACKLPYTRAPSLTRRVAELLAEGKVIGWFQGAVEFGPRALGSRSILADPRRPEMKDLVNRCIKHREGFRPFAPAVLAERAAEYFECDHPSPFMLFVCPVRPEKRHEIPAVTHVDGSARLQTVRREDHPRFWELIKAFESLTGVPIVLNTSFNLNGEPMVCTPWDAIRCFFGSGLDYLAMGPFLVGKGGACR
ncbi:MAG: carbamoyltransferase [Candidatus Omnitrophica bacterium]|nr:carbamoyltransferase [Candidatus Omnitrophota bacterium]